MANRPKRNAVMSRETTDKLLDNKRRRSSAQVQQDKQVTASTFAAAEVKKATAAAQQKQRIAVFEDQLREEDRQREKNMARPDLVSASGHRAGKPNTKQHAISMNAVVTQSPAMAETAKKASRLEQAKVKTSEFEDGSLHSDDEIEQERQLPESELEFSDIETRDRNYTSSDGPADIPDQSIVDTESSDYQGLEDESTGDCERDEDYVMEDRDKSKGSESDLESEEDFDVHKIRETANKQSKAKATKKPLAEKPKRGDFRKAINDIRKNSAIAGNAVPSKVKPPTAQKRKQHETQSAGSAVEKRAKKDEGGLLSGWSNKLAKQRLETISARNKSLREAVEDEKDPLEYAGGEFDEDEPIDSVKAARSMKKPAVTIRGNRTTLVKILEPVVEPSAGRRRVKKVKYTFSSLPFPRGAANISYTREWRKSFKPTLIHWAATLEDPFGTNALMEDSEVITETWKMVFPSIADEVVGSSREAIIHVAGDALTDWRSSMGKEGLRLVLQAFNDEGVEQEDAPSAAAYYLENYRFIYQNPDDNTGNKGAFLSPLVSACLAVHLKKTINNVIQYGYPVGALAIVTAVLERGLELVKAGHIGLDGHDAGDNDGISTKKRKVNRYAGYTDAVWGGKTRGWAASIGRLDEGKWKVILQAAIEKMDWSVDDGDIEEGTTAGGVDPRSLIEI